MFDLLVNADGGLTTAGYAVTILAGIAVFAAAVFFSGRGNEKKQMPVKHLVFCAMALALAYLTSYIRIFKFPWGGSITLCSMLFIVLVANWYGVKTGVCSRALPTGSFSLSRILMYCPSFRYAAIIFWHLRCWGWPVFLQRAGTVWSKDIYWQ